MKRSLVLTLALSLTAAVLYSSLSSAQTAVRGFTVNVTNTTTPKRDRARPYVFTTRGRIVPPPRFCAPGQTPTPTANCVPIRCPAGARDARYCARPGLAVICSGKVAVRVRKGTRTLKTSTVNVKADCTYRSKVTFRTLTRARRGLLKFRARFAGNTVLQAKNSPTRTVRAG